MASDDVHLNVMDKHTIVQTYLDMGMRVIPFMPNAKNPSYILDAYGGWTAFRTTMPTMNMWNAWLVQQPKCNIGMITGKYSGYLVVDCDTEDAIRWVEEHLPNTSMWAKSGGGVGKHFFYKYTGEQGDIGNLKLLNGQIDIRSESGVVLLYPSIHPTTQGIYQWGGLSIDTPDTSAVVNAQQVLSVLGVTNPNPNGVDPTTEHKWSYYLANPQEVRVGDRNNTLIRIVGGLIQQGLRTPDTLKSIMTNWYNSLPDSSGTNTALEIDAAIAGILKKDTPKASTAPVADEQDLEEIDAFMSDDAVTTEWDIEGYMPSATTGMIVAPPGHYKTWLMMYAAICMGSGMPFLGKPTTKRRVAVIQQEDAKPINKQKVRTIYDSLFMSQFKLEKNDSTGEYTVNIPHPDVTVKFWKSPNHVRLDDDQWIQYLEDRIVQHQLEVIFIDPLYLSVSAESFMAQGAQQLGRLKVLRDKYKCSFWIVHHTKKSTGDGVDRMDMWGSQLLNAWLESGWQIRSADAPNRIRMHTHFKTAAIIPTINTLEFDINTELENGQRRFDVSLVSAADMGTGDGDGGKIHQRIMDVITTAGKPLTVNQISAEISDVSRSTISRRLSSMWKDGFLEKNGNSQYLLPPQSAII